MSEPGAWPPLSASDWNRANLLDEARRRHEETSRALLLALIEQVDDLDRLRSSPTVPGLPPGWADALDVMRAKALRVLGEYGVEPVDAIGTRFDPAEHHVIEAQHGSEPPGTVIGQLRAGYRWNGRMLRPAEVITVSKAGLGEAEPEPSDRPQEESDDAIDRH